MTSATDTHVLLRAFAQELARCGMRAACSSPGSRSAPLVLALASEPGLRCYSHVDERCAGFFALGLAKASGLPVAVACTSGTAAVQLHAAAIEAREARVPLLMLTADRPAELRDSGAGQAIDQLHLYGRTPKWFAEVELTAAGAPGLRWVRTLACRAFAAALEGRPGPVHLNFPLREPLVCDEELPPDASARTDGAPFVRRQAPPPRMDAGAADTLAGLLRDSRRGVLIAGREEHADGLPAAAASFAAAAGWPLLADPMSGARRGPAAIAHYDALLRDAATAAELRPDLVLRVGDLPVSKPLREWLAGLEDVAQAALDPEAAWQDPAAVLSNSLALDPADTLRRLAVGDGEQLPAPPLSEPAWLASWRTADSCASEAILGVLRGELSEPSVAAELGVLLPGEATVFVASSMPVRDLETFWPVREDPPRVLCNRGANGIDGTVSAAFGAAASGPPTVLLTGDVALAHDIGGLLAARRLGLSLTIVLIDNGGGGIFDFLPVSRTPRALGPAHGGAAALGAENLYTRHVATPTGLDFADAARLYGLAHTRVTDLAGLRTALEDALATPGSCIVEVRSGRAANVRLHARVWEAVARAASG
jgi:2-succinyl-5-enolpyruvyl-6-hydroxy-3-cyclohexene-1-carboxylate synthase